MDKVNKVALETAITAARTLHRIKTLDAYAEMLGMTASTLLHRRNQPDTLTIREAYKISRLAGINFPEFV